MNIYLDRIYRIIRIYFGLVFLYPVHPVDPVRKIKVYFVKFSTGRMRIFFALMAAPVVPGMLPQTN